MITLKKIDVYGQLVLIVAAFAFAWVQNNINAVYGYYVVGGWQVISFTIHALLKRKLVTVACRGFYGFFLTLSVLSLLFSAVFHLYEMGMYILVGFFFLSPVMAIYYLLISFRELGIWQHRHFIQLR